MNSKANNVGFTNPPFFWDTLYSLRPVTETFAHGNICPGGSFSKDFWTQNHFDPTFF